MDIRVFFKDESTRDVGIQTYFPQEVKSEILIVKDNGKEELLKNVSHMIMISRHSE